MVTRLRTRTFAAALLAIAALGASACAVGRYPYRGGYERRADRWQFDQGYRDGFDAGRRDAFRRARYDPGRWRPGRDRDYRNGFTRGYDEGYRTYRRR